MGLEKGTVKYQITLSALVITQDYHPNEWK